ncbi:hypothetical protein SAMN05444166_6273 [Singulisphaera sp. GP187]|uniref:DUF6171 family protein n=1 Tax=Singulisphaera sp. GP187 TaxID=1882752 RepID=UPI0009264A05|nr:DUF6171 family protein [Singulisphaera sp. GP187]SIO60118.1 hypothetical protein SAMN05444166_6273 [Singulisphaera sp. GP187]
MNKCDQCPLSDESRSCPGERSRFVCKQAHQPGLIAQLRSFATAIVQHVSAGSPRVTEAQKNARLAICQACEDFDQGSCRRCGCGLDLKAGWSDQACPAGKWGAIPVNQRA